MFTYLNGGCNPTRAVVGGKGSTKNRTKYVDRFIYVHITKLPPNRTLLGWTTRRRAIDYVEDVVIKRLSWFARPTGPGQCKYLVRYLQM